MDSYKYQKIVILQLHSVVFKNQICVMVYVLIKGSSEVKNLTALQWTSETFGIFPEGRDFVLVLVAKNFPFPTASCPVLNVICPPGNNRTSNTK